MENYKQMLHDELNKIKENAKAPRLLLHSCCAPCSSYVLKYLTDYFNIVLFYYNPNISPYDEYAKRVTEQKRLIEEMPFSGSIEFMEGKYDHERYLEAVKGLEDEPEGGARCDICFRLRLEEAAIAAKKADCDYFTTTLSVSPHKSAQKLNTAGRAAEEKFGVKYLYSDFKKDNGYKQSIELSEKYGLYRQNYCGCVFSVR